MNTKFLLIFMIFLNFTTVLFAFADYETGNVNAEANFYMVDWMLNTDDVSVSNLDTISNAGGIILNESFKTATNQLKQEQGAGTSSDTGFFNILDTAKMILAFFSLLTPLPVIAYFNTVGLPLFWAMLLGGLMGLLYIIGLMEFLKGSSL